MGDTVLSPRRNNAAFFKVSLKGLHHTEGGSSFGLWLAPHKHAPCTMTWVTCMAFTSVPVLLTSGKASFREERHLLQHHPGPAVKFSSQTIILINPTPFVLRDFYSLQKGRSSTRFMSEKGSELLIFKGCTSDESRKVWWCVFSKMPFLSHLHVPLLPEKLKHFAMFLALPQPLSRTQAEVGGCSLCLFIISMTAAPPSSQERRKKAKRGCVSCDRAIIISL